MSQAQIPALPNPSYDPIKEISQQVIEEKQCIIEQIYKQLRASLTTTNYLTQQLEDLKAKTLEIDLLQLKTNGFIRQDNSRSLLVLDITKTRERGLDRLILDTNVEILNEVGSADMSEKLATIQIGYKRAVQQIQLLLKALQEKQQKQAQISQALESKDSSLACLCRQLQQAKQRQAGLRQVIVQNQQKYIALLQQFNKKEGTFQEYQQILKQKQQQNQYLLSELAQRQQQIENIKVTQPQTGQAQPKQIDNSAKELHEQIELLEMELEQEKRERALEKAEWKQEIHKLKDQLVQRKADDEIQQENMALLQSDNEGLRKEINDLKDIVYKLQKKRESQANSLSQLGSSPHENRVTNDILIKKQEDQLAIQSPHHFLPYQINSVDYFHIQTEPIPPSIPQILPENHSEPNNRQSFPPQEQPQAEIIKTPEEKINAAIEIEKIEKNEVQPQLNNTKQQMPSSPQKDPIQISIEVQPNQEKKQEMHHTNKSFPQALTEQKDEKQLECIEKQQLLQNDKEKNIQERQGIPQEKQQPPRKQRKQQLADLGLKPMKPDKPGKHRKVIRINY